VAFALLILLAIIVLVLVGWAVVGVALTLLWWALIGLAIGAIGRLLVPGRQSIGLLVTSLLGIAASLLGGVIARAADLGGVLQFIIAIAVAALLVAIYAAGARSQTPERRPGP
jgi:uncharacterized membrane protein YeaQ/YmgE (transglycosylase-associated protein family)